MGSIPVSIAASGVGVHKALLPLQIHEGKMFTLHAGTMPIPFRASAPVFMETPLIMDFRELSRAFRSSIAFIFDQSERLFHLHFLI